VTNGEQRLTGGSFYGSVLGKQKVGGAIFTEIRHSNERRLPAHSHELPFFCLFFGGDYAEKYGRRDVQFRPFTLSFRPAGELHQDAVGPRGASMFGIEVERSWQERMDPLRNSLRTGYDFEGGEPLWLALKLYVGTRASLAGFDLHIDSLTAELLGSMSCQSERCTIAPHWLRLVRERLNSDFRQRLSIDELSLEAGVHPVHLSRIFRRFSGRGIGEYVHRLRVREACERMLDREVSLADISFELGFADQAHFSRVFRAIAGVSPGAFRRMIFKQRITTSASRFLPPTSSSAGRHP
jgi:AraC family transcriptional regulator